MASAEGGVAAGTLQLAAHADGLLCGRAGEWPEPARREELANLGHFGETPADHRMMGLRGITG